MIDVKDLNIMKADEHLMMVMSGLLSIFELMADHIDNFTINGNDARMNIIDFVGNKHEITIKNLGSSYYFNYKFDKDKDVFEFYISSIFEGNYLLIDKIVRNLAQYGINMDNNKELYDEVIEYLDSDMGDSNLYLSNVATIIETIKRENMLDIYENNSKKLIEKNILKESNDGLELNF